MDCLFEILVPLLGEFVLGAGFELLAEVVGRLFVWIVRILSVASDLGLFELGPGSDDSSTPPRDMGNVGRVLLWILAGAACGWISVVIVPHPLARAAILCALNLIVTPFAMAGAVVWATRGMAKGRAAPPRRSAGVHFACAYAFGLFYLLVRLGFARP